MKVKVFSVLFYGMKKYSSNREKLINFIDNYVDCEDYDKYIIEEELSEDEVNKDLIL